MFQNPKLKVAIFLIVLVLLMGAIGQFFLLQKAHATFENYYAFRGCTRLISTTTDSGICKTNSGQIIKIVEFKNKWYLDGDLPCGFLCLN